MKSAPVIPSAPRLPCLVCFSAIRFSGVFCVIMYTINTHKTRPPGYFLTAPIIFKTEKRVSTYHLSLLPSNFVFSLSQITVLLSFIVFPPSFRLYCSSFLNVFVFSLFPNLIVFSFPTILFPAFNMLSRPLWSSLLHFYVYPISRLSVALILNCCLLRCLTDTPL